MVGIFDELFSSFEKEPIAFSLIISAIIVGSSIIIQTGMEPRMWGAPTIGLVGFSVAGFFGMWLVIYPENRAYIVKIIK